MKIHVNIDGPKLKFNMLDLNEDEMLILRTSLQINTGRNYILSEWEEDVCESLIIKIKEVLP